MKNLKISHQLLLIVASFTLCFATAMYFELRKSADAIYVERYGMIRSQVESASGIFKRFQAREETGELSREEAQRQAFAAVSAMSFAGDNFVFAYDYDVILRIHPDTKSIGLSYKGKGDPNGFPFRDELVKVGRNGGGAVDYLGTKPGKDVYQFPKSAYALAFDPWKLVLVASVYVDDLQTQIFQMVVEAVAIGAGIFLIGAALAFVVIRNISLPLNEVRQALDAVAAEDVEIEIPHTTMSNEVGTIAKATEALQEKVRDRHTLSAREKAQHVVLENERHANNRLLQQEADAQTYAVTTIGVALEKLAIGDLTIRCDDLGVQFETLRNNFNSALTKLEAAMSRVNAKGIDIGGSKEEIRRASNELSQRTERQAASLEEASAALDELTVAVRHTAHGAHEAAQRVIAVSAEATRSDLIVAQAIEAMGGIEQSASEISKIIGVIDEIAFQTNLLALNAGVEAARAGESGKGFAVVAQEVRELAQRSAAAAKQIKEQISRSSSQVQNGVRYVGEAGEALKRISGQIKSASEIVDKIAHSASEQDTTLRSISSSVNQVDAATQRNAAMAEETTASAEALAADTDELLGLISGFRIASSSEPLREVARQLRLAS
ncbi:cache domain-containing protein [Ensifer sp. ENS02]|uniref:methyl-accepting chemotaxis protein n=1 Tax=Ensifer sp. ENS02 TaxID=2769290 RepID=UPI001781442B|nr:methyl-accepting chemotaxis protein [Ensifer sp. ENS02]MBD9524708.1 cache domain-containing protein [Ensifer sp. ENS02]